MTDMQMLFCEEYLKNGLNATQAYLKAYKNVKNKHVAESNGYRLLRNAEVKSYIDEKLDEIHDQNTADIQEVMEYLTSVMRGEAKSEEVAVIGVGAGCSEVATVQRGPTEKDKLKAAELLGKSFGMFTDKVDMDITVPIFEGADDLED